PRSAGGSGTALPSGGPDPCARAPRRCMPAGAGPGRTAGCRSRSCRGFPRNGSSSHQISAGRTAPVGGRPETKDENARPRFVYRLPSTVYRLPDFFFRFGCDGAGVGLGAAAAGAGGGGADDARVAAAGTTARRLRSLNCFQITTIGAATEIEE